MGLREQIQAGAELKRAVVTSAIDPGNSRFTGSIDLGAFFMIISSQVTTPSRLRIYGNASSRDDATELARPFESQSIPSDISLITDIKLENSSRFRLHPPLFGANLDNPVSPTVYYTVDTLSGSPFSSGNRITITRFLLEDRSIDLSGISTREVIEISGSISANDHIFGEVESPKTYLIYKLVPDTSDLRIRLYTREEFRDVSAEINRSFATEPSSGSGLIADILVDSLVTSSFTPIILGRNGDDLTGASPEPITYYTLSNITASPLTTTASLYVFSLED